MLYQIPQTYNNFFGGIDTTFKSLTLCYRLLNKQEPVVWWHSRTFSLRLSLRERGIKFEPDLSRELIKDMDLRNQHQPSLQLFSKP